MLGPKAQDGTSPSAPLCSGKSYSEFKHSGLHDKRLAFPFILISPTHDVNTNNTNSKIQINLKISTRKNMDKPKSQDWEPEIMQIFELEFLASGGFANTK